MRPADSVLTGAAFPKEFDWIVLCIWNLPVQSSREPLANSLNSRPHAIRCLLCFAASL